MASAVELGGCITTCVHVSASSSAAVRYYGIGGRCVSGNGWVGQC
jgi:hypothetical protein